MEKIITIPEDIRDEVQRCDLECSSRRDIIIYILSNDSIKVSKDRMAQYQKEYEEKFKAFDQIKHRIELEYVQPAANNKAINWQLDYTNCKITITIDD